MDKFLIKRRDIDEVDAESDQNLSVKSCTSKKTKPRPTRKYDDIYLSFEFTWTENEDNPLTVFLVCGMKMSNEPMVPSKLGKHFKINTLIYKINPQAILRECLNTLQKQQILLRE